MAKNTSITLDDHFDDFVMKLIQSGRYGSASDVIRSALRLLETQESKLNTLRQLLIEGEESGMAEFDIGDFITEPDNEKQSANNFQTEI